MNAPKPLAQQGKRLQALEFLGRHRREVDGVADDAVLEEVAKRRRRLDADEFLALAGRRRDMGCGHDLRQLLQAMIDRGLLVEHVERRARHVSRLDRVGQRGLVDQVAARGVDDPDALLRAFASRSALTMCRVWSLDGMWSDT